MMTKSISVAISTLYKVASIRQAATCPYIYIFGSAQKNKGWKIGIWEIGEQKLVTVIGSSWRKFACSVRCYNTSGIIVWATRYMWNVTEPSCCSITLTFTYRKIKTLNEHHNLSLNHLNQPFDISSCNDKHYYQWNCSSSVRLYA